MYMLYKKVCFTSYWLELFKSVLIGCEHHGCGLGLVFFWGSVWFSSLRNETSVRAHARVCLWRSWSRWAARDTLSGRRCRVMAAREPGDGLRTSPKPDDTISVGNESENPPEKDQERRKWDVGNNWGFSLEGIFRLALKFFKGKLQFKAYGGKSFPVSLWSVWLKYSQIMQIWSADPHSGPTVVWKVELQMDHKPLSPVKVLQQQSFFYGMVFVLIFTE